MIDANRAENNRKFTIRLIFTAQRYTSEAYAVVVCLSVCLYDCPSYAGILNTANLRMTQTTPHDSPGTL